MPLTTPSRRAVLRTLGAGAVTPVLATLGARNGFSPSADSTVRLGIVADPQYADKPNSGNRRYGEAADKLTEAVVGINEAQVDLLVHLGDAIDGAANADVHLKRIFDIFAGSKAPVVHLVGNHCLDGGKKSFDRASGKVAYHGAMRFNGWRFVLLDGNAISIRGHAPESPAHLEATAMINNGRVSWGGGLGKTQRDWLIEQLDDAKSANEHVVILCHFPNDSTSNSIDHLLWDHAEVAEILAGNECVKAWFCGHNHQGGYGHVDEVHHVTFPAICDAPQAGNAWAIAEFKQNQIDITGHGTVPSRRLVFKRASGPG